MGSSYSTFPRHSSPAKKSTVTKHSQNILKTKSFFCDKCFFLGEIILGLSSKDVFRDGAGRWAARNGFKVCFYKNMKLLPLPWRTFTPRQRKTRNKKCDGEKPFQDWDGRREFVRCEQHQQPTCQRGHCAGQRWLTEQVTSWQMSGVHIRTMSARPLIPTVS